MPDLTRILLIEDDVPLASMISEYLRGHDFHVDVELRGGGTSSSAAASTSR